VSPIRLPATDGDIVVGQPPGPTMLFCYPHLGHPEAAPLVPHWDLIPGARGCTPEACGFRDWHAEFTAMGVQVLGVSTEEPAYQREAAERLVKRLIMLLRDGVVERVWYPVFPPDRHAAEVLDWLRRG
jgi:peroxiredoxin